MSGRVLHAQLHLLDRQLIDLHTGRLLGKVDDVELDLDGDPPLLTALISGGVRIPAARIAEIDSAIKITPYDLDLTHGDTWVERHIIDKIPGAGDATE
jgi:sporulation protein YlmC with PRC-barrel domain